MIVSKLAPDENRTRQFSQFFVLFFVSMFLFVCLLVSGEDDSHETCILCISLKVVVIAVICNQWI